MKIRLALKIWNSSNYNSFMISKSRTTVLKWVNNYKTPNSVLRKMKLSKLKDKILSKNNIISNKLNPTAVNIVNVPPIKNVPI